jgi:hypothetical protein
MFAAGEEYSRALDQKKESSIALANQKLWLKLDIYQTIKDESKK